MPNLLTSNLLTVEEIRNSPSRADGMSEAVENDYRRKTCLFIKAAGKELELPVEAIATALVFFHKFFTLHSFLSHERFVIGSACLFLAGKVEESPKRVEVVVSKCYGIWTNREPFGENEKPFKRLREKILIGERCVLHTLGFQLSVEHPYSTVMYFLKMLFAQGKGADGGRGADKALNRQLTQAAMSFVNDSLLTTVCLQYAPNQVAAAVVYLSYLYMGLPRVDMDSLKADDMIIAAICDTIISLYDENEAGHAPVVTSGMREQLQKRISSPVGFPNPTSTPTASTPTPMPARLPSAASPRPTPSPSPGYNPDTMPCRHSNGDTSSSMERERGVASGSRSGDMSARHADGDPRRRRSSASTSARSHSPSRSQGSPTKRKSWDGSASSLMNGAGGGVMREKLPSSGEEWVDVSTKRQRPL